MLHFGYMFMFYKVSRHTEKVYFLMSQKVMVPVKGKGEGLYLH